MKKITSLAFVSMVFLSAMIPLIKVSESFFETTVYVDPPTNDVSVGNTFVINVSLADDVWLQEFEFYLGYNTSILDGLDAWVYSPYETPVAPQINDLDGYVHVIATHEGPIPVALPVSGSGTLASITFKATAVGSSFLDLYGIILIGGLGTWINHTTVNGSVTVSSEITVPDDYPTIQEAINHADEGDTIFVRANTYYEHVIVNKSVSLIGENKEITIIDGNMGGTVVDVTASGVLISNFSIRNSMYTAWYSGIKVEMDNCTITNNIITNNWFGIYFGYYPGQQPRYSSDNMLCRNNIKNNRVGVYLLACENSTIFENNVTNSNTGVFFFSGSNNQIYHNNFIENIFQVSLPEIMSELTFSMLPYVWDNLFCVSYPSGGNYWNDYNGTDLLSGSYQNETVSDGIGDTAYTNYYCLPDNYPYPTLVIIDSYPLMAPISFFDSGTWDEVTYYVHTISNSTVSEFNFNPDSYLISFNVNGTDDTVGFCRATIPKELIWCDDLEEWNVTVNGDPPTYLKTMEDADYTHLYFTYDHSIQEVQIKGIYVIPEFPTWTSMLFLLIVLTVAIAFYKRRLLCCS